MAGIDILAPDYSPTAPPAGGIDILAASTDAEKRAERLRKIALGTMKQSSGEPGAGDLYSDSFTLGLMKPVGALASSLGGEVGEMLGGEPASFGERWKANTGAYDDYLAEGRKNSGRGGTAADIAGSLTSGGPARELATAAGQGAMRLWPTVKSAIGMGAVEGAARNSEDVGSAAKGALEGGAISGATTGLLGGVTEMVKQALPAVRRARAQQRTAARGTPPAEIRDQSRAMFKQLDDAGIAYDNNQTTDFVDGLVSDLNQNGYDPRGAHRVLSDGVVSRLEGLRGQPMSLETLQQIRSQAASNATNPDANVRRIAGRVMNQIDGFVRQVDPAMAQIPHDQIAPLWTEARRLWRTAATADDINWRLDKADRRTASTGSGTNVDNPIRQNIRGVLDKAEQPGRFNPYSEAELAQMERVVSGSPAQNILRSVGNRFGGSGPLGAATDMGLGSTALLGSMLHGAEPSTAALIGAGTGAGLYGVGKGARMAADRMSQDEADSLVRLISTGSLDRAPIVPRQGPPTRASLAALLAPSVLARGAGVTAGGAATR